MATRGKRTGFNKLGEVLPPLLFFVVTVGLYIPSTLFLGNIDDFLVDYPQILPAIGLIVAGFLVAGLVIALLVKRSARASWIYMDLLFGVTLGVYVQSNFLNGTLKQLNGTEVVWDNASTASIISIAAWLLCLIVPHVVRLAAKKVQGLIVKYGSVLLSAMQIVSLVVLVMTTSRAVSNDFALTTKDEFLLTSNRNTVVFVVDTLDAQWTEQYVLSEPEFAQKLEGFTYFDNVVAEGAPTILGMRILMGGHAYDPSIPLEEYYASAYEGSTLFSDLKEHDYAIRLYTNASLLTGADVQKLDNLSANERYGLRSVPKFVRDTLTLTAYNGAPYPLKPRFLIYSGELTGNAASTANSQDFTLDDAAFYQSYREQGLSLTDKGNAFVLYHLFGAHGPYTMDEFAQRVEQSSLVRQIHGSFRILFDYMDEMKSLGVYENSTIIITADHGGVALYQNPAVLIKKPGASGPIETNSAPVTFTNLVATYMEDVLDNYAAAYGPGMFDIAEDAAVEERPHTFASVLYTNVYPGEAALNNTYLRFGIGNPARDNSLIVRSDMSNPYVVGTTVAMCGGEATNSFLTRGFSVIEASYRWTDGDKVEIPLRMDAPKGDLVFSMEYKTFNGAQHVLLYANDTLVMDDTLSGGTLEGVVIPKSAVGDGKLTLTFELPDAISPKELGVGEDGRRLAISISSFLISEAK